VDTWIKYRESGADREMTGMWAYFKSGNNLNKEVQELERFSDGGRRGSKLRGGKGSSE